MLTDLKERLNRSRKTNENLSSTTDGIFLSTSSLIDERRRAVELELKGGE